MIAPITKQAQKAFLQAFHVTTTTRSRRPQSMWITVVVSLLQTSRSGFGRGSQSLRRKECVLRSGDLYRQTVVVAQNMSRGPWEIWAWCWNLERPTAWPIHWWHQKKTEDLTFEDYERKSEVFFWLERYRSSQHSWWRFGQGKNDGCVEGLQKTLCSISETRDRPFAVQGRLRLYLPWKLHDATEDNEDRSLLLPRAVRAESRREEV